jgi:hypothetical protein
LPQHLLGLLLIKITGAEKRETSGITWRLFDKNRNWLTRFFSGVSLGKYILLPYENEMTVKHENGHSKQSEYLVPLYLLIVGIYSAVFCNLWDRWFHKDWNSYARHYWYYKTRWTERWADKLGNVDRDAVLAEIDRPAPKTTKK